MFRSINGALEILRSYDSQTAITPYFVRMLIKEGKVKYLTSGSKIILDVNSLKDFLGIN